MKELKEIKKSGFAAFFYLKPTSRKANDGQTKQLFVNQY